MDPVPRFTPAVKEDETVKKRHKRHLPKVISRGEAANLLAAADDGTERGCRDRLALELMYRAGLRVSEVVALRPRDVHPEGFVDVYEAKGGDGTAYFTPEHLNPLLAAWLEIRQGWGFGNREHLLLKRNADPLSVRYLQRLMERLKREIGLAGKCTPHVLRHSFATELLEEGFTIIEVQSALRHASVSTTQVYLHVRDDQLRRKFTERGALGDRTLRG